MSLKKLPKIEASCYDQKWHMREDCIDSWDNSIFAKMSDNNSISIFDAIGEDFRTNDGVTAKKIGGILRSIGDQEVFVNINSPGGDFFEGVAIYNILRAHPAKVTVRVVGLAASAASVIAMAGDEIQIGKAGFLMIHNAWTIAVGDRHDIGEVKDTLTVFDASMADVYSARTGIAREEIAALMDGETWFTGAKAIEDGFADSYLPDDLVGQEKTEDKAVMKAQAILENGLRVTRPKMSRSERRALLSDAKSPTPSARVPVTPSADTILVEALEGLSQSLRA